MPFILFERSSALTEAKHSSLHRWFFVRIAVTFDVTPKNFRCVFILDVLPTTGDVNEREHSPKLMPCVTLLQMTLVLSAPRTKRNLSCRKQNWRTNGPL